MADMTNYERIKNMSVDEMENFICGICDDDTFKFDKVIDGVRIPNYDEGSIKKWLESEADNG